MIDFNQFLKKDLNEPQLQAVIHKQGALIVIAGAGSGKTRVITSRIANLILNENASPKSIIALTFTNKAAGEMKDRLTKYLGHTKDLPFVGTFHSYCLLLLRSNPTLLKYPKFSILDSEDQSSLIKKILKRHGVEKHLASSDVTFQISNLKNKLTSNFEDEFLSRPLIKEIYLEYESEKSAAHCFDFDDLILEILKLLKNNKDFKNNFQNKVKHILVDEYQDTNTVQHEMLKAMALDEKQKFALNTITVVGDEDQSIYSWRGAVATNMLQFQSDFAPVEKIKIEQNYRSVQPILQAANSLISFNKLRTNKNLWSDKIATDRIVTINCRSGQQEAEAITNILSCCSKEQKLSNVAIFYRTHYQSRNIEEALVRNSIPYKIVGGIRFYERKEIKDLLAYLKLIVNPFDRTSFFRIINCPNRGFGPKFEEILYEEWNKNSLLTYNQILEFVSQKDIPGLTGTKKETINDFLSIFYGLNAQQKPSVVIDQILKKTEYLSYLKKTLDPHEADTKTENVKELENSIKNFEHINVTSDLEIFLQEIALLQEKIENKENSENEVLCMTLHAAKGLEFNTVIISGLEEGILPSYKSLNTNKELEEERRLFYVGITRAKERLILFHANSRNSFGQINDQVTSRFLGEIPSNIQKSIDITEQSEPQVKSFFNKWLGNVTKSVLTFQDFEIKKNIEEKLNEIKARVKIEKKEFIYTEKTKSISPWKKHQLVSHKKFGVGTIKEVEKKEDNQFYITAIFNCGEKKILSNFLSPL